MARVLAEGTGAEWAQVWLSVGDRLTLAATWPPDAPSADRAADPRDRERPAGARCPCGTAASCSGVLRRPGAAPACR